MLSPRLTNCNECANISSLLEDINCTLKKQAINLYNNTVYSLNLNINKEQLFDLSMYKRILIYKACNIMYACPYSVEMIASKVKLLKYK